MTTLPPGWTTCVLGEVARWGSGGTPTSGKSEYYDGDVPWVVIGDMDDGPLSGTTRTITRAGLDNSSAKLVPPSVVLVAMYGYSIGKLALPTIPVSTNQAIAYADPYPEILDRRFLFYFLLGQRSALVAAGKGGAQPNISQTILRSWPIALPPLAEQQRIASMLDEAMSHLQAAVKLGNDALGRTGRLRTSALAQARTLAITSGGAKLRAVGSIADTTLGKMLDARGNYGKPTQYLANINVRWGSFDCDSLRTVLLRDDEIHRFSVREGDVMVCEGGEPGRCAIWRGEHPEISFQKALHRVRVHGGEVTPEWFSLMLEEAARNRRLDSHLTGTTIKHLPQQQLRKLELPVPSLTEQTRILEIFEKSTGKIEHITHAARTAVQRGEHLIRFILAAATRGELTQSTISDKNDAVDRDILV